MLNSHINLAQMFLPRLNLLMAYMLYLETLDPAELSSELVIQITFSAYLGMTSSWQRLWTTQTHTWHW